MRLRFTFLSTAAGAARNDRPLLLGRDRYRDIRQAIAWMRASDPYALITPGQHHRALGKTAECGGCIRLFVEQMRRDGNLAVPSPSCASCARARRRDRRQRVGQPASIGPAFACGYSSQAWTTVCLAISPSLSSSVAMQNDPRPVRIGAGLGEGQPVALGDVVSTLWVIARLQMSSQ